MEYTVYKLAKMAGITVRTLHHYDEIGLLKPAYSRENGYRYYGEKELIKLQQILFFRELEFPLEQIKQIMNSRNFKRLDALKEQRKLLILKKQRIDGLLITINKTIKNMKGGVKMTTQDLYDSFDDTQMKEYQEEAKQRWGNTEAYKQSIERTKHWTKTDYKRVAEETTKFTQKLADAMDEDIESAKVQRLIAEHYKGIQTFYDCSYEMYRGLGKMYIDDKRFTAFYDKFRPGLAQFVSDAIQLYCDVHEDK